MAGKKLSDVNKELEDLNERKEFLEFLNYLSGNEYVFVKRKIKPMERLIINNYQKKTVEELKKLANTTVSNIYANLDKFKKWKKDLNYKCE